MQYRIFINNKPMPQIVDKIDNFCITENNGFVLDTLTISISDSKNSYYIPTVGATIDMALTEVGGNYLVNIGTFIVNKVESSSEHIYLFAISSLDLSKGKDNKMRNFFYTNLGNIVKTLASELSLKVSIDKNIADIYIPYLEQHGTTNLQMLNTLAELFNAIIKIQNNYLGFLAVSNLKKNITLPDNQILSIATNNLDGYQYKGVWSGIWNTEIGDTRILKTGEAPYYYFYSPYKDLLFNIHVESKLAQLKMKQQLRIKTIGNPEIQPGFKLTLQKNTVYKDYEGEWLIQTVTHNYDAELSTNLVATKI